LKTFIASDNTAQANLLHLTPYHLSVGTYCSLLVKTKREGNFCDRADQLVWNKYCAALMEFPVLVCLVAK